MPKSERAQGRTGNLGLAPQHESVYSWYRGTLYSSSEKQLRKLAPSKINVQVVFCFFVAVRNSEEIAIDILISYAQQIEPVANQS